MRHRFYKWMERQLHLPLRKKNFFFLTFTLAFAGLFLLFTTMRRLLYRFGLFPSIALPGVTISVGNIGLGGTGKTPGVRSLVNEIKKQNFSVVVLTRGYGSDVHYGETLILLDGEVIFQSREFDVLPDEAMLLSHSLKACPIVVGPDRVASAKMAISVVGSPACWILDDGFQHFRLKRSVDIVLINAESLHRLPAIPIPCGAWRECFSSLRWADHVVLTKAGSELEQNLFNEKMQRLAKKFPKQKPQIGQAISVFSPPVALGRGASLDQSPKRINVFCGIANPEQFRKSLIDMGFIIAEMKVLPDHALANEDTFSGFNTSYPIVMTAKDYWRQPLLFTHSRDFNFMIADFSLRLPESLVNTCLDALKNS